MFIWVLSLVAQAEHDEHLDDYLAGPELIDIDEINTAFNELEKVMEVSHDVDAEVLEGEIYNFNQLDCIDMGVIPHALKGDVSAM